MVRDQVQVHLQTWKRGKEGAIKKTNQSSDVQRTGRDRIMVNLKQLKGQEKYKGVSMTDDHTIKDRNVIQERVEKAKRAKANEWRVRGTPKNGMCLKKSQIWKAGE